MSVEEEYMSIAPEEEKNASTMSEDSYSSETDEDSYYSEEPETSEETSYWDEPAKDDSYYSEEPEDDYFDDSDGAYSSEENLVCEEPQTSSSDYYNDSDNMSHADWSEDQGGSCSYDYGSGDSSDLSSDEPNMSVAPICSQDNYFSSMPEDGGESSGMCSENPNMSFISEYPVPPHLVLDVEDGMSSDVSPYIDMVSIAGNGTRDHEKLQVTPSESGRIYWDIQNATHAQLNGRDIPLSGSEQIFFEEEIQGSFWPYEIIAWNEAIEHSSSRVLDAYMLREFSMEPEAEFVLDLRLKEIKSYYVDCKFSVSGIFKGKLSLMTGQVGVTPKWSDGVGAEISKDIVMGDFVVTPKFEIKVPVPLQVGKFKVPKQELKDNQDSMDVALLEVTGALEVAWPFTLKGYPGKILGEVAFTPIKVSNHVQTSKWSVSSGSVTVKGGGSIQFLEIDDAWGCGKFTGALTLILAGEFEPNWENIIKDAVAKYGSNLGLGSSSAIAGAVAGVATSGALLVTAGVATILLGTAKFMEASSLKYFRTEILPGLVSELRRGIKDSLAGVTRYNTVAVIDQETAYQAGLAAGTQVRVGLESNGENLNSRSEAEKQEIIDGIQNGAESKMKFSLWKDKASTYSSGTWFDNDYADVQMQQYWWLTIIGGDCPKTRGGHYLETWLNIRVGGSAGNVDGGLKSKSMYAGDW